MSHVTHTHDPYEDESCHTHTRPMSMSDATLMRHASMSHVTLQQTLQHTATHTATQRHTCVMSLLCDIWEWVMSHTHMSCVSHTHMSYVSCVLHTHM